MVFDLAKFPKISEIDTTKLEIGKMSVLEILQHGESSYYDSIKDIIGLHYHDWLNSEDAWKILIDDVNHETEHQILFQLINEDACYWLDTIVESLRDYLVIGFKDIKDLNRLRQLFAQANEESREELYG